MKRVSFEIAMALKEAGYPQECDMYYPVPPKYQDLALEVAQPTYLETWLWLWREKNINIKDSRDGAIWIWLEDNPSIYLQVSRDPEEAIISAIEFLVDNDLIK